MPAFDLRPHEELRGATQMRVRLFVDPRRSVQSARDRDAHQRVIGRMKMHFVDAFAKAIVRAQFGRVAIGIEAEFDRARVAGKRAELRIAPCVRIAGAARSSASSSARSEEKRL